jgi:hypothetical protein
MLFWHMKLFLTPVVLAVLLAVLSTESLAQPDPTALESLHFSADIHTRLPAASGTITLSDDSIAEFDPDSGLSTATDWLVRLDRSDIDAFHAGDEACGTDRLFSTSTTVEISGTVMSPADVFTASGNRVLDAAVAGIPSGVNVDAISRDPASCALIVSVDRLTELGGAVYGPSDLIRWSDADGFSLFRATGLSANLDALQILAADRYLFSVNRSADLDGLRVRDEDIIEARVNGTDTDHVIVFAPADLD